MGPANVFDIFENRAYIYLVSISGAIAAIKLDRKYYVTQTIDEIDSQNKWRCESASVSRISLEAEENTLFFSWYFEDLKMCRQLFAFVFLCGVVGIRCQDFLGFGLETRGLEPVQIEHYDNVGNQTFVFRWIAFPFHDDSCFAINQLIPPSLFWNRFHFEDGSVASGSGVLIAGIDHRLQNGYFRFPIRGKIYEFNYHIDDSGADHGSLSKFEWNALKESSQTFYFDCN